MKLAAALIGLWLLAVGFAVFMLFSFNPDKPVECVQFVSKINLRDGVLDFSEEILINDKTGKISLIRAPFAGEQLQLIEAFTYDPRTFAKIQLNQDPGVKPGAFQIPILANAVARAEFAIAKTSYFHYCMTGCNGVGSLRIDLINVDLVDFSADFNKTLASTEELFAWSRNSIINTKVLAPEYELRCLGIKLNVAE